MASPPKTSVLSVDTLVGLISRVTEGVSTAQVMPKSWMVPVMLSTLACSEGTQTHAPNMRGVKISIRHASKLKDAYCKTLEDADILPILP